MTASLRVAHVTSSLFDPLGGAEQYCIELARWQASEGHQVTLFGAGASDRLRAELLEDGISVHDLVRPRPYQPGVRGRSIAKAVFHARDLAETLVVPDGLRRLLITGNDIVHVHRWQGLGAGALRLRGVTTVHTVHDYALIDSAATSLRNGVMPARLPLPQRARTALVASALGDLDRAIFPTKRTLERHRLLGLDLGDRGEVVPHGWHLPPPAASPVAGGPKTFTFMGKLMTDKGVETLLAAWGDGVPDARLVFAGAGDLEPRIVAAAGSGVEFRGWLDKPAQAALLAESDMLVLPSLWPENFPLVVAEALIAGVPVLATQVSAPEVLEDGVNAVVAEPGAAALREAIGQVVNGRIPLDPLRIGAKTSAQALDMDVHGTAVIAAYDRARRRHEHRAGVAGWFDRGF